jgi:hypothetical protein
MKTSDGERDFLRAILRTKHSVFVLLLALGCLIVGALAVAAWWSGRQLLAIGPTILAFRRIRSIAGELAELERVRVAHR